MTSTCTIVQVIHFLEINKFFTGIYIINQVKSNIKQKPYTQSTLLDLKYPSGILSTLTCINLDKRHAKFSQQSNI